MLYGANPVLNQATLKDNLRPVMQLTSRVISTRHIPKGAAIGYGSLFTTKRNSFIGVVACGYADGYPRLASSPSPFHNENTPITPVAVDGHLTQIIGRVSMDMLFVDLTDLPMASIGSKVELWGDQIPANQVANAAGTIAYELFCNIKRVELQYTDSEIIK
jgi:alanine racemase